jgi:hypothetical protein
MISKRFRQLYAMVLVTKITPLGFDLMHPCSTRFRPGQTGHHLHPSSKQTTENTPKLHLFLGYVFLDTSKASSLFSVETTNSFHV